VADRNPRIAAAHLLDHSGDESGSDELWRTNPDLARAAAREKLNVPKTLAQLIEYHIATLQKRISVNRSLDTVRTSVEQADAKSIIETAAHIIGTMMVTGTSAPPRHRAISLRYSLA
jgi:hypothetical protein